MIHYGNAHLDETGPFTHLMPPPTPCRGATTTHVAPSCVHLGLADALARAGWGSDRQNGGGGAGAIGLSRLQGKGLNRE